MWCFYKKHVNIVSPVSTPPLSSLSLHSKASLHGSVTSLPQDLQAAVKTDEVVGVGAITREENQYDQIIICRKNALIVLLYFTS